MKKLLSFALMAALIVAYIKKTAGQREAEWHGLTEAEARSKLDEKLPHRIPDDKRDMISDKVVAKMRDRGVISEDADLADESVDIRDNAAHAAESTSS